MDFELSPTEEERERAHGWERRPGSVRLIPEAEAFRAARRLILPVEYLGEAEPGLVDAQQYAVDRYLSGEELEPQTLGDAAAAALAGLSQFSNVRDPTERAAWPFVDYWVQRSGIVHAIDTMLEEAELDTFSISNRHVQRAAGNSLLLQGHLGKWQRLREVVGGLPERDYQTAVAHAETRRATLPLLLRAALAYAFPARPAWAEADAKAAISEGDGVAFNLVAASLPSPELLPEGLVLFGPLFNDGRALTLLLRFGEPVAELLVEHALEEGISRHNALELLGMVGSVSLARRLLPIVAEPSLRSTLLDTFDRHPRHALLGLQGEKPPRDPALKGRLRDWRELYPDLAGPPAGIKAKPKPKPAARPTGRGSGASAARELPRGVTRVLQEPTADLPPAGQQAVLDIATALKAGEEPVTPLTELAKVASPGAARRVRVLITAWGAAGDHALALAGIQALGAAGHDFALGQLAALRDGASHRKLSEAAQAKLARSKLSDPELDDRKLDDFGLGAELAVSLGKRTVRFDFGPSLGFVLRGEDGKPKTSFPAQRKDDDPAAYTLAKSIWERLRLEATPELRQQTRRLESAMVDEREWRYAAFRSVLLKQPLLAYLARQLVWQGAEAGAARLFRVAEDGTLADADDAPLELDASAAVRLPHPLTMAAELGRWGELFADYEITQPFEQLGREFVPRAETGPAYLGRLQGTLGPKARFVLEGQGWEGEQSFAFGGWTGTRLLRGKPLSLWLSAAGDDRFTFELHFEADKLDAIARSELYRDLAKCGLRKDP